MAKEKAKHDGLLCFLLALIVVLILVIGGGAYYFLVADNGYDSNSEKQTITNDTKRVNEKWGYVSNAWEFTEGLAAIERDKWGFIDKEGNVTINL